MRPSADTPGTFTLFVYGTLKRGGCRHAPLADRRFLGEVRTEPLYRLYDLGSYPGLVHAADGDIVHGELYEVDLALVPTLDRLEGAPDWFDLAPVEIAGRAGPVWAYYYRRPPAGRRVAGGRWATEGDGARHMTAEDAFLEDMRENPEDDAVRLIYADWLEDRGAPGDADRAEFIRVQIGAVPLRGQELARSQRRARDLLELHWDDWTGPVWRILGRKTHASAAPVGFRRGFLHELTLDAAELFAHHRALFRLGPIGKLRLLAAGGHGAALAACEPLSRLNELEFADYFRDPLTASDMMALATSPHLGRLRVLRLNRNNLGDAGVYALAGADWLPGVVVLDLTDNGLSFDGVLSLAHTRRTFRPFWLGLARNPIGPPAGLLPQPPGFPLPAVPDILTEVMGLDLTRCNLTGRAVALLASLPLRTLRELDLSDNHLDDEAARALSRAPWVRGLRRLGLRGHALTHEGMALLAPLMGHMNVEL